jgi:hypothetical protein
MLGYAAARRMKTNRKVTTPALRSDVIVDFIFEDGVLFVALSNLGARPARNVSVAFEPKFHGADGLNVASMALFKNVEFLAPHKTITTLLDSSAAYFARGEPTRIAATISYVSADGTKCRETIHHDLEIYRDLAYRVRA